jgi:O-antigen/teichoic acid export membrane protein
VNFSKGKFYSDLVWNLVSYVFIGCAGILINLFIVWFLNYDELGIFNQVFSIYIILSQLAAFGIHLSLQRFVPQHSNMLELNKILSASILISSLLSISLLLVFYLGINLLPIFPYSGQVLEGTNLMVPAVFFFTLNKLLLSFLMGKREMKKYAVLNTMRYFLMLAALGSLIYLHANICLIFTVSELILFTFIIPVVFNGHRLSYSKEVWGWAVVHFKFGRKAFIGNFVFDVNTKVDVLILGLFMNNSMVGLYSFSSTFFEGFSQLTVLIRNNINPILTRVYFKSKPELFARIVKGSIRRSYKFIGLSGLLVIIGYPFLLWLSGNSENMFLSWQVFSILVLGLVFSGGYQVVILLFNQIHMPAIQSVLLSMYFGINVLLNFILVPQLGLLGSALATSLAAIFSIYLVKYFTWKTIALGI